MIPPASLPPALPLSPGSTAPASVRLDAFQTGAQQPGTGGNGMGQAFNTAIDGFSTRAKHMQELTQDIASRDSSMGRAPAVGDVQSLTPTMPGAQPAAKTNDAMSLMVDSFNFAIEASLVSRAATQFTGSISTLMKGQ